jgi:hypothetical protein
MESTAVWSLKPEQWGSPLAQVPGRKGLWQEASILYNNNNNNNNNKSRVRPWQTSCSFSSNAFQVIFLHLVYTA